MDAPPLLNGTAFRRLIVHVADPVALAAWYHRLFGWQITVDDRADGWIELDAGSGVVLALHGGARGPCPHWPKIQVHVADVSQAHAVLIAGGIDMSQIQSWRHLEWAEGADPEGHVFQIVNR